MQKALRAQTSKFPNCQKLDNRSMKKKKENVVSGAACLLVKEKMDRLCHTVCMLCQGLPFWDRKGEALAGVALRTIALSFFFLF